jgi:hypothetical protein
MCVSIDVHKPVCATLPKDKEFFYKVINKQFSLDFKM